jgi:hypothetical protein
MKNNYYLVLSSCLFIVTIIYFVSKFDWNNSNNYEILLIFILLSNLIFSTLFWKKANYKSIIHKMDSFFAKLSFICFLIYCLFIKECIIIQKIIFLLIVIIALLLFYISNKWSKKQWCSRKHIIIHFIFHVFTTLGTLIVII